MISQRHETLFARAVEMAQNGEHRVRVGAIAAIGNTQISGAFNTLRNSTLVEYGFQTTHAEMACLDMVSFAKRSKVTLYVARIDANGKLRPSFPCERCLKSIMSQQIKDVVFWNGTLKMRVSSHLNQP